MSDILNIELMMKYVINEFRMIIAEWLLGKIVDICPKNNDGKMLTAFISIYFKSKVQSIKK